MPDPSPYYYIGLPLVYDLRGKFTNSIAAYAWALTNVMPHCNRSFAHTPAGGGPLGGTWMAHISARGV